MKKKLILTLSMVALLAMIILGMNFLIKPKIEKMTYPAFLELLGEEQIQSVIIQNEENLLIQSVEGVRYKVPNPQVASFKETLLLQGIEVSSKAPMNFSGLFSSLFILGIVGTVIYMRKNQGDNKQLIQDVHKSGIKESDLVKFENVAGNEEAKDMVKDVVAFIQNPEKYSEMGAKMPRGILLYGLPGTGKTLLAKAIAGEAGVPFFAMSGSDFVQMYVGVGANRVRQLFKSARKSEKAVIFIDEIDALGKSRSGNANAANDEREQTLNALLTEMSGFHTNHGIVVIGATNRVDTLDAALLRPGRFDRHIEVALPDHEAREAILKLYAKNKPLSEDVDLHELAKETVRFSGAMLEHLMNEAAICAANNNEKVINKAHLNTAFYTVIAGMEKKNKDSIVSLEDKKVTAYHEAGHALISKLLQPDTHIAKVTIIPTTKGAGGYNYNIPKDRMYQRKKEILARIQVLLAGRAAEELIFGDEDVTTGAVNDIKEASRIIYDYFVKLGMDEGYGLFNIEVNDGKDNALYEKCRLKIKELYALTRTLLEENQEHLEAIVTLLLEKETITGEDMDRICNPRHYIEA